MNSTFKLHRAPIVEAVLDVDCDMPPGQDVVALEQEARQAFGESYPKTRTVLVQEHKIETKPDEAPKLSIRRAVQALQFLHEDEKQIVQVRTQGFSFNRLAPYSTLGDYLPEIERTWLAFVALASPVQIRTVRLRYINRILLPMKGGSLDLSDYLKMDPPLPDEETLTMVGFLTQTAAVEKTTGNEVNIVVTPQSGENGVLPVILDITVAKTGAGDVHDWAWLSARVHSLRTLKNRVFRNSLTEQCLNLFQQP